MTAEELAHYIQSRYGTCGQMTTTGKCPCLYYGQDQQLCKDYRPTIARTWEELRELAEKRSSSNNKA